ncbi:MAG: hypothetical protein Q9161_006754 [Pseudevernia consocians]
MPSILREENGNAKPQMNGDGNASKTNSNLNGDHDDAFQHLPKPQQDILQLHGPRQKYCLEKAGEIPELRSDREILVQVVAIGLNPVDWKGPDYDFGLPSFPWVNGRDFAGIVVKTPKGSSRIKAGDVVRFQTLNGD